MTEPRERWYERMRELYDRSPVHATLGMRLDALAPGSATVLFEPRAEFQNVMGIVHGGTLATVADSALLQAVRTLMGEDDRLTTLELKISYLAPARGDRFRCLGEVVRVGGSTGVATATITDADGEPVAASLGTIHLKRAGR
ncbi:MAG: PaaI family thioesterase [Solirubrobacteraceae bacterium]